MFEIAIWEHLRDGKGLDDLLEKVPDEFYQWVKSVQDRIFFCIEEKAGIAAELAKNKPTRKDQALFITKTRYPGIAFSVLDGKDYKQGIWRLMRPRGQHAFKTDIDLGAKMIIMQGLPASGKSTRTEEFLREHGNAIGINKDLLRKMLHCRKFTHRNEGFTRDAACKLADWFLTNGVNIIIDDTNLNPGTVQGWVDMAKIHQAKIEYERMDAPVEERLRRDRERADRVGDHVILKMAMQ